jgi:phosphoglycolate phosphatase
LPRSTLNSDGLPLPSYPLLGATVVFDLDGTLIDTAPDLTNALNHVLVERGHAPVSRATIRSTVGHGARIMIEEGLRHAGVTDDVDAMLAAFLRYYEAHIAVESRPFPGAVAVLEELRALGARLAICTNKREYLARLLLEALFLDSFFEAISGRDTFGASKPDPSHLIETIQAAGGDPRRAIMIGDSEVDVRAASAAGVPVVWVSFGYAPPGPLGGPAPDATIDDFEALTAEVRRLFRLSQAHALEPRSAPR